MTFIAIAAYCSAVGITEKLAYSPALAVLAQTWAGHLKHSNH